MLEWKHIDEYCEIIKWLAEAERTTWEENGKDIGIGCKPRTITSTGSVIEDIYFDNPKLQEWQDSLHTLKKIKLIDYEYGHNFAALRPEGLALLEGEANKEIEFGINENSSFEATVINAISRCLRGEKIKLYSDRDEIEKTILKKVGEERTKRGAGSTYDPYLLSIQKNFDPDAISVVIKELEAREMIDFNFMRLSLTNRGMAICFPKDKRYKEYAPPSFWHRPLGKAVLATGGGIIIALLSFWLGFYFGKP